MSESGGVSFPDILMLLGIVLFCSGLWYLLYRALLWMYQTWGNPVAAVGAMLIGVLLIYISAILTSPPPPEHCR